MKDTPIVAKGLGPTVPLQRIQLDNNGITLSVREGNIRFPSYPNAKHLAHLTSDTALLYVDRIIQVHNTLEAKAGVALLMDSSLAQRLDPTSRRLIWGGIAVAYFRSFDGGSHKLKPEAIFPNGSLALDMHQTFLRLRNMHFAHDLNDFRNGIVGAVLDQNGTLLQFYSSQGFTEPSTEILHNVNCLIEDVLAFTQTEIRRLEDVMTVELETLSPAERLLLPEPVIKAGGMDRVSSKRRKRR